MKRFILVAGHDYHGGADFKVYCTRRIDQIVAANAGQDLNIQLFDIRRGEIVTREIIAAAKTDVSATDSSYDAITRAMYTGEYFNHGQRGTLSITHIYEAISNIGSLHAGELHELSVFSHAWHGGLILVNSFDDRSSTYRGAPGTAVPVVMQNLAGSNRRDPDDKDSRSIDFLAPNVDIVQLRAAFHADAFTWLWGCTATEVFKDFVYGIVKMAAYTGAATPDTAEFTIFNKAFIEIISDYLSIVPAPTKSFVKITFKDVRKLLCKASQNSYSFEFAIASNRKVFASYLGSGSLNEGGTNGLWKANPGRVKLYKFYKDHLGILPDTTGRKYATYLPTLTCP